MRDRRPTVLVLLGCFSRGIEATGPNQSMIGMAEWLSDNYRFRVIAEAGEGDKPGYWTRLAGIEQLPLTPTVLGARGLRQALRETPHDLLISNSIFDRLFTIPMLIMRRVGLVRRMPVLLAPRGEFSPGALNLSGRRKAAYLAAAQASGLLRDVAFQATGKGEEEDIRRALGQSAPVYIAPNIRSLPPVPEHLARAPRQPLRVAFLSRIDRKKNLEFALETLAVAGRRVVFNIFGPISNAAYWRALQLRIAEMPEYVEVVHKGTIPQRQVLPALAEQDLFFLPTLGENFGHAIADALTAGTPVLLSDLTPWRGIAARGAGWDLALTEREAFVAAIREMADMAPERAAEMRSAARQLVEEVLDPAAAAEQLALTIRQLTGRRGSRARRKKGIA